jgi:hypothetical protein
MSLALSPRREILDLGNPFPDHASDKEQNFEGTDESDEIDSSGDSDGNDTSSVENGSHGRGDASSIHS